MEPNISEFLTTNPLEGFLTFEDLPKDQESAYYKARFLMYSSGNHLRWLKRLWGSLFGFTNPSFIIMVLNDCIELQIFDAVDSDIQYFIQQFTEYLKQIGCETAAIEILRVNRCP